MNLIQKTTLVLSTLVAATIIHAQNNASGQPAGSLGVRYAEAAFGVQDFQNFGDNAYQGSLSVNIPVQASLDVGLSYGHAWLDSTVDQRSDALAASATYYTAIGSVKPFLGLAVGHQWDRASFLGSTAHDDFWFWGAAIGVEIPVQAVTLTPRLTYVDGLESGHDYNVTLGTEASYWFTNQVAGFVDVSYSDPKGNSGESWNYSAGVRLKF